MHDELLAATILAIPQGLRIPTDSSPYPWARNAGPAPPAQQFPSPIAPRPLRTRTLMHTLNRNHPKKTLHAVRLPKRRRKHSSAHQLSNPHRQSPPGGQRTASPVGARVSPVLDQTRTQRNRNPNHAARIRAPARSGGRGVGYRVEAILKSEQTDREKEAGAAARNPKAYKNLEKRPTKRDVGGFLLSLDNPDCLVWNGRFAEAHRRASLI